MLLKLRDLIETNASLNRLYVQVYGQAELKELLRLLPSKHNLCMITVRVIGAVTDRELFDL